MHRCVYNLRRLDRFSQTAPLFDMNLTGALDDGIKHELSAVFKVLFVPIYVVLIISTIFGNVLVMRAFCNSQICGRRLTLYW